MKTSRAVAMIPIVVLLSMAFAFSQTSGPTLQERLGYPADARLLIIHADDFGMSHSVNRATIEALENGWITSASIMVPCPWFPEAASWAKAHPQADLGIHLTLNSEWQTFRWSPIASRDKVKSLLDQDGYFFSDPSLFKGVNPAEVREELSAQVAKARAAGVHITHLDSHMAALMRSPELFQVYRDLGRSEHLPVFFERQLGDFAPHGSPVPNVDAPIDRVIALEGGIPLKDWTAWYKKELSALKPGVYEVIVHLSFDDEEMRGAVSHNEDWGPAWRQADFDMLRSPEFQSFLRDEKFILIRWDTFSRMK
jgi:predicted glycoside hydrolase/deacetylase ChbG (UPF0249 family)